MEESVLVIVGEWECGELGRWRFRVSREEMARFVAISEHTSYKTFLSNVVDAFNLQDESKASLSFMYEPETEPSVFTQAKMPPVLITSDVGLRQFRQNRNDSKGMNLLLSLGNGVAEPKASYRVPDILEPENLVVSDDILIAHMEIVESEHRAKTVNGCGKSVLLVDGKPKRSNTFVETNVQFKKAKMVDEMVNESMDNSGVIGQICRMSEDVESLISEEEEYDYDHWTDLINQDYPPDWDPVKEANEQHRRRQRVGPVVGGQEKYTEVVGNLHGSGLESPVGNGVGQLESIGHLVGITPTMELPKNQVTERTEVVAPSFSPIGFSLGLVQSLPIDGPVAADNVERENLSDGQQRRRRRVGPVVSGQEKTTVVVENLHDSGQECGVGHLLGIPPTMELPINQVTERSEVVAPTFSPIGFSLGLVQSLPIGGPVAADNVQSEKLSGGQEPPPPNDLVTTGGRAEGMMVCPYSPRVAEGMLVGQGSESRKVIRSLFASGDDEDVFVEDSFPFLDAPPVRDNMRGLPSDQANMDLRKGEDAIYVGKVFKDKNQLRKALSMYALKMLFHFKMGKSDRKRAIANCADPKCDWRVYATTQKDSTSVEIRKVCMAHTCDVGTRSNYGKNASAQILADIMQAKFANGKKGPRACEIPEMVLSECNVTISYMKAWHAKEFAISSARGSEEGSYQFLSTYLHLLETSNPGTISSVHTTVDKEGATLFKYLFFALGGSIAGYKHLRKVIVIDGTQMKGKYKGCLVAASGQDGNTQIFPLAFGVIDGENEAGWEWFFRQIIAFIPDEDDLVFVSDRHAAIYAGLSKVYPRAHHAACAVHLIRNVKHLYKCEGLAKVVDNAARSYTVGDFRYWFDEVKSHRPACATHLEKIGFEHWSLANFKGRRYNVMSSNISESLNNAMKKAVEYPIAIMVEFIRGMLMRWFCSRRKLASQTISRCTPEIEEQLIEHLHSSTDCGVISASTWIYQVNDGRGSVFKVDLQNRTCSCRVFDVLMIPCPHALAAIRVNGIDIYSLVANCYTVKEWASLYENVILPVPKEMDVHVPSPIKDNTVKPPKTRRPSGRPKKKRIPSQGEQMGGKVYHKCSRCSRTGHNRATCKNPI